MASWFEIQKASYEARLQEEEQRKLREQERIMHEEAAQKAYADRLYEQYARPSSAIVSAYDIRQGVIGNLIEGVLWKFIEKVDESNGYLKEDSNVAMVKTMLHDHINENSVYEFTKLMETANTFTASLIQDIKEAAEKEVPDDVDISDTLAVDPSIEDDVLKSIDGNETVDAITQAIAVKVGGANEDFLSKMQEDYAKIQDILANSKENIASVRTGDPEMDKVYRESFTEQARIDIENLRLYEDRSVFEQLMYNLGEAVIGSEALKEDFSGVNGKIDIDKKANRVAAIYTVMESLYSIGLLDINKDNLLETISFQK